MLKYDRYGFNDDFCVYRSRSAAVKVAKTLSKPVIIRSEVIEGEQVYAIWSQMSLDDLQGS